MAIELQSQDLPKCKKCGAEKRVYLCGVKTGKPYKESTCLRCNYARKFPNKEYIPGRKSGGGEHLVGRIKKRLPIDLTKHPSVRRWDRENPEKRRAHKIIETAVRTGVLVKGPCARCGASNVHAHHDDYSKPMEVMWLCPKDHKARHRELDLLA